ncbi:YceI family protein [Kerstersia sp.]|uniref:YceI family protein n=1 Tax=Kerstersia sp. TaxID=1930783 RepID=UPI003F919D4B
MNFSRLSTRLGLAAALTLGATLPAFAAPVTYVLDGTHTAVSFSYRHVGLSTQTSRFNNATGTIVLDTAAKTGKVNITVDTRSVNTGLESFNGHIQAKDFLDTAAYPTATFVSDKVVFDGERPVAIDGKLTIKGITQDVTVTIDDVVLADHPMAKKPALGAAGSVKLTRSEFDMGKFVPVNSDEVTLRVTLEAIQQ